MSLRVRGCADCLRKAIEIDELKARNARLRKENARLRQQLGKQHRLGTEPPFGSATPSARLPVKPGSTAANQLKRGGARVGHRGHGRRLAPAVEQRLAAADCCAYCGGPLDTMAQRSRTVVDAEPLRVTWRRYRVARQRCRRCGRFHRPVIPGVLPKAMLSNRLLATLAGEHYLYGATMGQLAARTGLRQGTLFGAMHQLAKRLGTVPDYLAQTFRQSPRKHADETSWRIDGSNGYSWFFGNLDTTIFRFADTRAGSVVTEVLGQQPLPGTLVVDRYAAYNVSPCARQFCYAHLLRDLKDLAKDCPDSSEVAAFVQTLAPLLADAMHLQSQALSDQDYYAQAQGIKERIQAAIDRSARHFAVQGYQSIFREHHDRLYLWASDRRIPPDNNFAERALRPTVIARKVSFGSQSPAGAHTREILMTTLHTLAKRVANPVIHLQQALDQLVTNPAANLIDLLFPRPHPADP